MEIICKSTRPIEAIELFWQSSFKLLERDQDKMSSQPCLSRTKKIDSPEKKSCFLTYFKVAFDFVEYTHACDFVLIFHELF